VYTDGGSETGALRIGGGADWVDIVLLLAGAKGRQLGSRVDSETGVTVIGAGFLAGSIGRGRDFLGWFGLLQSFFGL
jgi:hypothetical protein